MKFVDEVEVLAIGGDGGRPSSAFLREKYRPNGGPAGGDGGRGGDVVLRAEAGLSTLLDFRFQSRLAADRGEHGLGKCQHGAKAADLVARVPVGTIVFDATTGEQIADLTRAGETAIVAEGGRGGLGNARFATSTNRAPRKTVPEQPGEERRLRLELRLLADAGVVGRPNAGKSTLIRAVSAARPKVAAYPFTTLTPALGVVRVDEERSFVLADVPGLIPGAHRGEGLGDRFLRHLARTRLLVHLLDLSGLEGRHPLDDLDQTEAELELHDPELAARPTIVVGNKIDLLEARELLDEVAAGVAARGRDFRTISAATGEGVDALVREIGDRLDALGPPRPLEDDEMEDEDEELA